MDDLGFNSRIDEKFFPSSKTSRPALGPKHPLTQWVSEVPYPVARA